MNRNTQRFHGVLIPKTFIRQFTLTQGEVDVIGEMRKELRDGTDSAALRQIIREWVILKNGLRSDPASQVEAARED